MKKFIIMLSLPLILGLCITPGHSASITLNPAIDTWVRSGTLYGNTSWGSSTSLYAGKEAGVGTSRSYLKFDLSGIPDGSIITQADLYLYTYWAVVNNSTYQGYEAYHVAADASVHNAMTWNNSQPLTGLTLLDTEPIADNEDNSWQAWNLLSNWTYANDLADNFLSLQISRYGDTIYPSDGTYAYFMSMDYTAYVPYLSIQYQAVPLPGSVLLLSSGLVGLLGLRRLRKK